MKKTKIKNWKTHLSIQMVLKEELCPKIPK
jgi:hypothetical protein